MTKILSFSLFVAAIMMASTSRGGNESDANTTARNDDKATVSVTVTDASGVVQAGKTVYLYKDIPVTNETLPGNTKRMLVTDEKGVATFKLDLDELKIIESQTTLYFSVFYSEGRKTLVTGASGITVKRHDNKQIEVKIPS